MDVGEKLVELIENANYQCDNRDCEEDAEGCAYHCYANCWAQFIADHLIANGVTVLPLKVGDVVYFPVEDYHDSAIIDGINITAQGISFTWVQYEVGVDITECWDDGEFDADEIGKTVFLTRAEAESHLPQPPKEGGVKENENQVI